MNQHLNHDHDEARSLHRVVRAMHDGECPACHRVFSSEAMYTSDLAVVPTLNATNEDKLIWEGWRCPACQFQISREEADEVLQTFAPFMERNLAVFLKWRAERNRAKGHV